MTLCTMYACVLATLSVLLHLSLPHFASADEINYVFWQHLSPIPSSTLPALYDSAMVAIPGTNQLLLYGGSNPDTMVTYNQPFMLQLTDDGTCVPKWQVLDADAIIRPTPRSGVSMLYSTVRQQVYIIGGHTADPHTGVDVFTDQVWMYSLTTNVWQLVSNSSTSPQVGGISWAQCNWADYTTQLLIVCYGGEYSGTPNNAFMSVNTQANLYQFDTVSTTWSVLQTPPYDCVQNQTICADSTTLVNSQGYNYQQLLTNLSALLTASHRPDAMLGTLADLLQAANDTVQQTVQYLNALNGSTANNDSTCAVTCVNQQRDMDATLQYPPPLEGAAVFPYQQYIIYWGGESCWQNSVETGGAACFSNSFWWLDTTTMLWSEMSTPQADASGNYSTSDLAAQAALWPSARAYGAFRFDYTNNKLWIWGGRYVDVYGVVSILGDDGVYCFNMGTLLWEQVIVQSRDIPAARWDTGATFSNNALYIAGGSQAGGAKIYSDTWKLHTALSLSVNNIYVTSSIPVTTAGMLASVTYGFRSLDGTQLYDWATDLATVFSTQILLTATADKSILTETKSTLATANITELFGGQYRLDFIPTLGRFATAYVSFDGQLLNGYPITFQVAPAAYCGAMSVVSGAGLVDVQQGSRAGFEIDTYDDYGNNSPYNNKTVVRIFAAYPFYANGTLMTSAENQALSVITPNIKQPLTTWLSAGHDTNDLDVWYMAPLMPHYYLHVEIDGDDIKGSPFLITAVQHAGPSKVVVQVLIALTCFAIALAIAAVIYTVYHWNHPIIKASTRQLFVCLLLAAIVCYATVFTCMYLTPISCAFNVYFSGLGYVGMMAVLLIRSYRIQAIFQMKQLNLKVMSVQRMMATMALLLLIEFALDSVSISQIGTKEIPVAGQSAQTFTSCDIPPLRTLPAVIYKLGLLGYGVSLAITSRTIPQEFNTSTGIAMCTYNTAATALVTALTYLIVPASPTYQIIIIAFAILYGVSFILAVKFLPKLIAIRRSYRGTQPESATSGSSRAHWKSTDEASILDNVVPGVPDSLSPAATPAWVTRPLTAAVNPPSAIKDLAMYASFTGTRQASFPGVQSPQPVSRTRQSSMSLGGPDSVVPFASYLRTQPPTSSTSRKSAADYDTTKDVPIRSGRPKNLVRKPSSGYLTMDHVTALQAANASSETPASTLPPTVPFVAAGPYCLRRDVLDIPGAGSLPPPHPSPNSRRSSVSMSMQSMQMQANELDSSREGDIGSTTRTPSETPISSMVWPLELDRARASSRHVTSLPTILDNSLPLDRDAMDAVQHLQALVKEQQPVAGNRDAYESDVIG